MNFQELSELWLKNKKNDIKPSTYESYCYLLRTIIQPELGPIPIRKINQKQLDTLFFKLQTIPRIRTGKILCKDLIFKSYVFTKNIIFFGQENKLCHKFEPVLKKIRNTSELEIKKNFLRKMNVKKSLTIV